MGKQQWTAKRRATLSGLDRQKTGKSCKIVRRTEFIPFYFALERNEFRSTDYGQLNTDLLFCQFACQFTIEVLFNRGEKMRGMLALAWIISFLISSSLAADAPSKKDVEAVNYARNLDYAINIITEDYIRSVPRADLINAALMAMYEAARIPAPASLRTDIEAAKDDQKQIELLAETRKKLGDVEALKGNNALIVSIRGMCKSLDPHTSLISGQELVGGNQEETIQGFGLEVPDDPGSGPLQVKNVFPGSPAQKAGIRPGDLITQINGRPPDLKGLLALAPSKVMPGIADSQPQARSVMEKDWDPVELTLNRPSSKATWKAQLTPTAFRPETVGGVMRRPDNSWDYMLDRDRQIALVRVGSFSEGTSEELEYVLARLQAQGIRGLILDLRWNPGGYFNEAIASARLFMGEELITRVKTRNGMDREYTGKRDVNFLNFALIVLVNGQTSGGAELIAAALQDNHRALVAGQRTLGKASVQTTKALRVANLGIKLTSGTFIRPSGKNLHRFPESRRTDEWGVLPEPKLEFRISPDLDRRLREWYLWQTLRPGTVQEVLPLDDPAADPQRQAAWKALAEKIK
jgi:carboxyl-terminal processing protease